MSRPIFGTLVGRSDAEYLIDLFWTNCGSRRQVIDFRTYFNHIAAWRQGRATTDDGTDRRRDSNLRGTSLPRTVSTP